MDRTRVIQLSLVITTVLAATLSAQLPDVERRAGRVVEDAPPIFAMLRMPLPAAVLDGREHAVGVELHDGDLIIVRTETHRVAPLSKPAALRLRLQGLTPAVLQKTPHEMHDRLRFHVTVDGKDSGLFTVREMLAMDRQARGMPQAAPAGAENRTQRPSQISTDAIQNHHYYGFTCPNSEECWTEYDYCSGGCDYNNPGMYDLCQQICSSNLDICAGGQKSNRHVVETEFPDTLAVANECVCDPVSYILTLGLNCFKYNSYFRRDLFQVYENRYCPSSGQTFQNVLVEDWEEVQFCYDKLDYDNGCQYGEIILEKCNITSPRS